MKPLVLTIFLAVIALKPAFAESYGESPQLPSQSSQSMDWTFTTSVNYSTGDYGTSTKTKTVYIPATLQRNFEQWRVYGTVPYISQESDANVNSIGGRPKKVKTSAIGNSDRVGGVGDIIIGGSYDLLKEPQYPLDLSGFGSIKFPTASDDKRLGTGEFDETVGLMGSKNLQDNWSVLSRLGYTFIGDPPGTDLNNQFFYGLGVGNQLTPETFVSMFYEEETRLIDGESNPRDLILGVDHKLNEKMGVFGNLGFGLSNSSPDASVTAGMSVSF